MVNPPLPPNPPAPHILPIPSPPVNSPSQVINTSKPNSYVGHSPLTTSAAPDIINSKNPFAYDVSSSINFQRIGADVPNPIGLHNAALTSIRKQSIISNQLMSSQKGAQTSESLIAKMYFADETSANAPMLQCQSVTFTPSHSTVGLTQTTQHIGVRAMITNRRLVFVDSTKNNRYTLDKTVLNKNSIITPFRKGESYQATATITDDLWFKPLPLPSITGVEIYTSHRSEASQYVANRVAPHWFFALITGVIGYLLASMGIYEDVDQNLMIMFGAVLPTMLLILALFLYMSKAQVKLYNSINSVTKSREIRIGVYDTIHNTPMHIALKVEDSQPLASIFHWCRELQNHSPRLSGNEDPLILM
jgi:hypothetical protein